MIDSILGVVEEVYNNYIILNFHNLFIKIFCNSAPFYEWIGREKRIYVYLKFNDMVSEIECYGFLTREERELFLKLQRISGIGAKTALQITTSIPYQELVIEIAKGNQSRLEKVKGIGKKTAGRIILELKESLKKELKSINTHELNFEDSKIEEIVLALMSLGFKSEEINDVISKEDFSNLSIEDGIKAALKRLSKI